MRHCPLLDPLRLWRAFKLCALLLWLLPLAATARDYVSERAYWTDTTGTASIELAQTQSYTPFQNILSQGFSPSVQWVRLAIAPGFG